jgi:hypothetical protein
VNGVVGCRSRGTARLHPPGPDASSRRRLTIVAADERSADLHTAPTRALILSFATERRRCASQKVHLQVNVADQSLTPAPTAGYGVRRTMTFRPAIVPGAVSVAFSQVPAQVPARDVPARAAFVRLADAEIHFLEWPGPGSAVVLLPGYSLTAHAFAESTSK